MEATAIETPGQNEVQVAVRACGINFADIAARLGLYAAAKGLYPLCPGLEFAGVVAAAGKAVSSFREGDAVFGAVRFGAYATCLNCPEDQLWHLPDGWDFSRGATFPVAYLTAYYGLFEVGHLEPSDMVLVHSAAGGVGTALLHLLAVNGNRAVGVVGASQKKKAAKAAGATEIIDKSRERLWARAERIRSQGYDIILDANGAATLKGSFRHLSPGGRLLIYGFASMFSHSGRKNPLKLLWTYFRTPRFNPFDLTGSNRTISGFNLIYLFDRVSLFREIMDRLLLWDAQGRLPFMPVQAFPFEEVTQAHQAIESGLSVGKLALVIS
jgi:NADPH:quinone reductase-like Zn-dependent oxidoreductase